MRLGIGGWKVTDIRHVMTVDSPYVILSLAGESGGGRLIVSDDAILGTSIDTLVGRKVVQAIASDVNGELTLTLSGEASIRAGADEAFESWEFEEFGVRTIVCAPGGELVVFHHVPRLSDEQT